MISALRVLALALALAPSGEDPRSIVRAAARAIEGDSVARVEGRWSARVASNPRDRLARLGLASLTRFRNDTTRTRRELGALLSERSDDLVAVYARLGLAWNGFGRQPFDTTLAVARVALDQARALGDSAATAEALGMAGFLGSRLGSYGPALDSLAAAERLVPANLPELRGQILCTAAQMMSLAGRPDARAFGNRGLALAKQARDARTLTDRVVDAISM
ncbi:MAG: hypothetical protein ABI647_26215, partial [Gemmatimonadota bacterium]